MATGAVKAPARENSAVRASTFRVGAGTPAARGAAVTAPTGGATIDAESRVAINALIARLQAFGLIA